MTLPSYWERASFSVAEVADLIGTPEATLRIHMHRSSITAHLGQRNGRRVSLSCRDAFFYFLVSELLEYGVPFKSAIFASADIARQATDSLPREDYLIVRTNGGVSNFTLTNERPNDGRPALVLPIRALAEVLIDDAAEVYAREAS